MTTVKITCPACKALLSVNKQSDSQKVKCPKCGHDDSILNFPPPQNRQVQCPKCKAILSVYTTAKGMLKCPGCKHETDVQNYPAPDTSKSHDVFSSGEIGTDLYVKTGTPAGANGQLLKPGVLMLIKGEYVCSPGIIRLQRGANTIGRNASSPKASILLDSKDPFMSRLHTAVDLVMKSDGTFVHNLSDAGSANGTWHNDEQLEKGDRIILQPGDIIRIGHTMFEFKIDEK
jgi:DNA-directed RNA polymerase subunit M/transcription elongation factor TFIIS